MRLFALIVVAAGLVGLTSLPTTHASDGVGVHDRVNIASVAAENDSGVEDHTQHGVAGIVFREKDLTVTASDVRIVAETYSKLRGLQDSEFERPSGGACRCDPGACKNEEGDYTKYTFDDAKGKKKEMHKKCADKCLDTPSCTGYEINHKKGDCEVHTGVISTVNKKAWDAVCVVRKTADGGS
ncbi:unnamed protein product [Vitrella brassicaformis CCMP3155]|uniref:Apple domain-containing protein n=1 Tax=Vitrella brassicaformis (strain CCMP3155) TaxID=1169540 RepID=A0A0G4EFH3_VITBC|nr:unnamed protein product [Vitrella brassicaformis CCMP3155]|eukprot:CEL94256.1 unnamed protein product [Vitrella brassicaformis CCMP3155]